MSFATIETICTVAIVWQAWNWSEARVPRTHGSSAQRFGLTADNA
jgi:hypothetical protein